MSWALTLDGLFHQASFPATLASLARHNGEELGVAGTVGLAGVSLLLFQLLLSQHALRLSLV